MAGGQLRDVARIEKYDGVSVIGIEDAEDRRPRSDHFAGPRCAFRNDAVFWRGEVEVASELRRIHEAIDPLLQDLGVKLGLLLVRPFDFVDEFGRAGFGIGAVDGGFGLLPDQLGDDNAASAARPPP